MKTDNAGVRSSVGLRTDDEPSSDKPDCDESERTRPGGRADGSGEGRLSREAERVDLKRSRFGS